MNVSGSRPSEWSRRLVASLAGAGTITADAGQAALSEAAEHGRPVAAVLAQHGTVDPAVALQELSTLSGVAAVDIFEDRPMGEAFKLVPEVLAREIGAIGYRIEGDRLTLASNARSPAVCSLIRPGSSGSWKPSTHVSAHKLPMPQALGPRPDSEVTAPRHLRRTPWNSDRTMNSTAVLPAPPSVSTRRSQLTPPAPPCRHLRHPRRWGPLHRLRRRRLCRRHRCRHHRTGPARPPHRPRPHPPARRMEKVS
jgi:hypothetical protein